MNETTRNRLVVLAIVAALLFGYPTFAVFDAFGRCCLAGALPLWIFLAWATVIACTFAIVGGRTGERRRR
ncbi:hypothetical protein HRbin40_00364 [bacterium HR40]|nr:hypothetical protein HRbin40_00364 [bacterium HR40]